MSRPKIYTWGDWRYEPVEYRLLHGEEQITLPVKTLDLLTLMIARAPRLATKEEILAAVWPDAAVEEGNIAFHINALRKALDKEGGESCIKTVRGRGYRFVASVKATPVVIPPSTQSLELPPEVKAMPIATASRPWGRAAALAALALIVAGAIAFAVLTLTRPQPIAIAPFEVEDGANSDFGKSLTPIVAAAVNQSGVRAIEGDAGSEARMSLNGRLILTAEKRWDVSLRLVRVDDGVAVWSWRFVAPYDEHRTQQQEQIAQRIADGLKSYLSLSGTAPVTR